LQLLSETPASGQGQDIALVGTLAYIANGSDGLAVYDISSPDAPRFVGSAVTDGPALGLAVAGSHAYIATGRTVQSIEITDPASPTVLDSWASSGWASNVTTRGGHLFVANGGAGLAVLDASDPAALFELSSISTNGVAYGVAVADGTILVADGPAGLTVVDGSDPANLIVQGVMPLPGLTLDVAASGAYACLANTILGAQIVDVSTPSTPRLLAGSGIPVRATSIVTSGSRVLVADPRGGLVVLGRTPQPILLYPDLNDDGIVNIQDFGAVSASWLNQGTLFASVPGDFTDDGWTDLVDLVVLSNVWLEGTADVLPPVPDPATWAQAPTAAGPSSITMTATTVTDDSGVEYFFDNVVGNGHDSGWQDSPAYTDTGLTPDTEYGYRVQARDKSPAQNTTAWSSVETASTQAQETPDETITIVKADYKVGDRELLVDALASEGQNAQLLVVGYGPMEWTAEDDNEYEFRRKPVSDPGSTITVQSASGMTVTVSVRHDDHSDPIEIRKAEYRVNDRELRIEIHTRNQPEDVLTADGIGEIPWNASASRYELRSRPYPDPGPLLTVRSQDGDVAIRSILYK